MVFARGVRLMYTELHARSAFSFLEGASSPEEMAAACARQGMHAMAVLDRDGVYGAPRFYLAAKKSSVKAHIGAEVTSAFGWRYPLLVESREGYQNLCRLITRMKLRARKGEGHVEREEIAELREGLICLTGGEEGPLAAALPQFGAASEITGGDGAVVCGFAGSDCEYAGAFFALGIYVERFGVRVSEISCAQRQFADAVLA